MTQDLNNFFVDGPITPEQIAGLYQELSARTENGAIITFSGQVRNDVIKEKEVTGINYSAYEPMAIETFEKIKADALRNHDINLVVIWHSLGLVPVGEIGLHVLIAAGHRKDTFAALTAVVEDIKEKVPVFGKELFADDSHVWKENR